MGAGGLHNRGVKKQDPPIERDLFLTLEEIYHGCIKKMKISRRVRHRPSFRSNDCLGTEFCRRFSFATFENVFYERAVHASTGAGCLFFCVVVIFKRLENLSLTILISDALRNPILLILTFNRNFGI